MSSTVLVADDDEINRLLVTRQLRHLGYDSIAVSGGEEAVEAAFGGGLACALMDCHMPPVDGTVATRRIRERERSVGGHLTIIALTAAVDAGTRAACIAAGMDDVLTKPLLIDDLGAMLLRWIGSPVGAQDGSPPTTFPAEDALLARLLGIYLNLLPERLLAIESALQEGDASALQHAAHSLRGVSALFGAPDLVEHCRRLEELAATGDLGNARSEVVDIQRCAADFAASAGEPGVPARGNPA